MAPVCSTPADRPLSDPSREFPVPSILARVRMVTLTFDIAFS